jgi:hypothetical protein
MIKLTISYKAAKQIFSFCEKLIEIEFYKKYFIHTIFYAILTLYSRIIMARNNKF